MTTPKDAQSRENALERDNSGAPGAECWVRVADDLVARMAPRRVWIAGSGEELAEALRKRGVAVVVGDAEACPEDGEFDLVVVPGCAERELRVSLAAVEAELAEKNQAIAQLQGEVQARDNLLRFLLNSKAWRLASQLRTTQEGIRKLVGVWGRRLLRRRVVIDAATYQRWIAQGKEGRAGREQADAMMAALRWKPVISLVMPVYNPRPEDLRRAIASVEAQFYGNWELCICDDASSAEQVRPILEEAAARGTRIKVFFSSQNEGISLASNRAIEMATGEFIGLLDHDDELTPDALLENVKLLQEHPEADVIYSDEDKLEADGSRSDPFFKPDWSPEFLLSCMYVCHFAVFRRSLVAGLGGFRKGFEGSQDYDLMLRACERTRNIRHIPKVLYHWRKSPGSTARASQSKTYSSQAGQRALEEHLQRRKIAGTVAAVGANRYRVRPEIAGNPLVSIIIPTKDKVGMLRRCLRSLRARTSYGNYEVLVVDNDSQKASTRAFLRSLGEAVLPFPEPFNFSRINNYAARRARGEYLVFLNNDTEVLSEEWLTAMLECLQLPEVGIAGAKLLYPNCSVQHGGVVLAGGNITHAYQHFPGADRGYFDALFQIRNVAAVTAACLMVKREVFAQAGGFDEALPLNYNDVDFCLRVRELGYRVVWTPYAVLRHYESATRKPALAAEEVLHLQRRWGAQLANDLYQNPSLRLHHGDYGLNF